MANNNNVLDMQELQDLLTQNPAQTVHNTVNDLQRILTEIQVPNIGSYRTERHYFMVKLMKILMNGCWHWNALVVFTHSDERKISLSPTFLRGLALNFFNQKEIENANTPLTFAQWKNALKSEFAIRRDSALKEIELVHRVQKPKESVADYAMVIRTLVKAAYPSLGQEERDYRKRCFPSKFKT